MKNKTFKNKLFSLAFLLAGFGVAPASYAVDLMAVEGTWTPAGGTPITMWGFTTGTVCPEAPVNWDVGPQLTDTDLIAGDLTINLRNCLSESVSIIIPGQPATFTPVTMVDGSGRTRITAFTNEAAPNGTASYTWTGVKPGTYLYQSGSHPAKQVQMGLYGALTIGSYPGVHDEVTLLYSEIDPVLHSPATAATPLGYHPRYYLVNGSESQSFPTAGDTNHPTLLRFLNAGLDFHVPSLNNGYMSLVAEDGNVYPFTKEQYSANLPAGKTIDALWHPTSAGDYVIYDSRGHGMDASLTVVVAALQPVATDDLYGIGEDGILDVAAIGVLGNDTDALSVALTVPPASASLVSSTSSGSLALLADGSFTYTPNADFNGTDSFTYKANDGTQDSNTASVSITVTPGNDAPVADAGGPYTATIDVPVTLDGTGSSDIDVADTLTYAWDFGDFTPAGTGDMSGHSYTTLGSYTVTLVVNDGTVDSAAVTATVEVIAAVNTAPVAAEDTFEVLRNSLANNLDLSNNDSDADSNLCIDPTIVDPLFDNSIACNDLIAILPAAQITITTGATTTRGGSVTVITNGVNYVPKRNFRGTDTFNYTVTDLDGDVSNEVTVRVNVVRP